MILRIIYDKNEFQDYDLGEFNNDKCKILTSVFPICEINIIYLHDIDDGTSHFDKVAKEIQSSKPFILSESSFNLTFSTSASSFFPSFIS